jgi:N-acetylglucosaminyldiphosphoundecaprenol N-acetyl-beta-D-mannosaminyltransferase
MKTVPVIGLPIAATGYDGAVAWIVDHALAGAGVHAVAAANTHVAALARADAGFGRTLARFALIVPDGMPLVWVMNRRLAAAERLGGRVYGPTLMAAVLKATAGRPEARHFLLGGSDSTLAKLRAVLAERFPGVVLAGCYSPPFGVWPEGENERIAAAVRAAGANIVWVGLGCPKQERWIADHKHLLPPCVCLGVGAAFAFHAGEVRQAPPWLQDAGLEWLHRLCMEPRRLFKRYFTYNSLFLYYLLRDLLLGPPSNPDSET